MHMEDLAWRYPAEPVERAAVRFCEALARWRGKPELETVRPRHLPVILSFLPPFLHSLRFPRSERFPTLIYPEQEAFADATSPTHPDDARGRHHGRRKRRSAPGDRTVLRYPQHYDVDYECLGRLYLERQWVSGHPDR